MSEDNDNEPLPNGDNGPAESDDGPPDARDSKGRFLPGNPGGPGNPQARNVHTYRAALAKAIRPADMGKVAGRLRKAALAGEPWAIREFMDRCLGKPAVQIDIQAEAESVCPMTEAQARSADLAAKLAIEWYVEHIGQPQEIIDAGLALTGGGAVPPKGPGVETP